MSGDFRVGLNDKAMREYLAALDEKGVTKILRKGLAKGGNVYRSAIRAEAPVKSRAGAGARGTFSVRKRGGGFVEKSYGTPGGLRASVKVRRIRSNPAVGVVVGPMGKTAFMRHWITQGTKAHLIRPKGGGFLALLGGFAKLVQHPGSKANPFVSRGVARANEAALDVAEQTILDEASK